MNKNCYHLYAPTGVKYATARIKQVLQDEKPNYIIRADIKSFYKFIPHYKLIQDIKKYYDDPKVQAMLENIITNPIETPRGYKNAWNGIALRGPLSQFFSGLYLKPLDDAFDNMDVTYLRYQDDILILCKTRRQLSRCRRRMIEVLYERRLSLSRKKTRIGCIKKGFHFLGIHYPATQTQDNTNVTHADEDVIYLSCPVQILNRGGGSAASSEQHDAQRIVPHPRTLRKAREQAKCMVLDGASPRQIRNYLHRWVMWWVNASETWQYHELLTRFIHLCWDAKIAASAMSLLQKRPVKELCTWRCCSPVVE